VSSVIAVTAWDVKLAWMGSDDGSLLLASLVDAARDRVLAAT
jgi:hypothetical protein